MFVTLFTLFIVFSSTASAAESPLTSKETKILTNSVGLTKEEISESEISFLRSLIAEGAVKKFYSKKQFNMNKTINSTSGEIVTLTEGDLKGDLDIYGQAYKVTSDYSGYHKYRLYGRWIWRTTPTNTYIDRFAIGFPSSSRMFFRTSTSGGIQFHTHDYWTGTYRRDYGVQPDRIDPNAGVGVDIDLIQGQGINHAGHINQYVYSPVVIDGINVKFSYSHAYTTLKPSFSVTSSGLEASVSTDLAGSNGWDMSTIYK